MFFDDEIFDFYVAFQCFLGKFRRLFIADIRIERRYRADAFVNKRCAAFAIYLNTFDAIRNERFNRVVQSVQRFEKFVENHGFECV